MTGGKTSVVRDSLPSRATAFPKSFRHFTLLNGGNVNWAAKVEAYGRFKFSSNPATPVAPKSLADLCRSAAVYHCERDGEAEAVGAEGDLSLHPLSSSDAVDPLSLLEVLGRQLAVYNCESDGEAEAAEAEDSLDINPLPSSDAVDPFSLAVLGRQVGVYYREEDEEATPAPTSQYPDVPILSLFNTSYNNSGNASPRRDAGNGLVVERNTYIATSPVVESPAFIAALEALEVSGGNEGRVPYDRPHLRSYLPGIYCPPSKASGGCGVSTNAESSSGAFDTRYPGDGDLALASLTEGNLRFWDLLWVNEDLVDGSYSVSE